MFRCHLCPRRHVGQIIKAATSQSVEWVQFKFVPWLLTRSQHCHSPSFVFRFFCQKDRAGRTLFVLRSDSDGEAGFSNCITQNPCADDKWICSRTTPSLQVAAAPESAVPSPQVAKACAPKAGNIWNKNWRWSLVATAPESLTPSFQVALKARVPKARLRKHLKNLFLEDLVWRLCALLRSPCGSSEWWNLQLWNGNPIWRQAQSCFNVPSFNCCSWFWDNGRRHCHSMDRFTMARSKRLWYQCNAWNLYAFDWPDPQSRKVWSTISCSCKIERWLGWGQPIQKIWQETQRCFNLGWVKDCQSLALPPQASQQPGWKWTHWSLSIMVMSLIWFLNSCLRMRCFWSMHQMHQERSLRKGNNSQELRQIFLIFHPLIVIVPVMRTWRT